MAGWSGEDGRDCDGGRGRRSSGPEGPGLLDVLTAHAMRTCMAHGRPSRFLALRLARCLTGGMGWPHGSRPITACRSGAGGQNPHWIRQPWQGPHAIPSPGGKKSSGHSPLVPLPLPPNLIHAGQTLLPFWPLYGACSPAIPESFFLPCPFAHHPPGESDDAGDSRALGCCSFSSTLPTRVARCDHGDLCESTPRHQSGVNSFCPLQCQCYACS